MTPGPQGLQGINGTPGDIGPQGVNGTPGWQGVNGTPGADGLQGIQGIQGINGTPGWQGIQGEKGDKGDKGDQGDPGPAGADGAANMTAGPQGPQGINGTPGIQGIQGIQGINGTPGDPGPQGIQGVQGIEGPMNQTPNMTASNLDTTSFVFRNGTRSFTDYVDINETSPPISPSADTLRLYVEDFKGFSFFSFVDDTGMVRKLARDSVYVGKADVNILKGQAVYASGSSGNVPLLRLAKSNSITTMPDIGIAVENINAGSFGRVMMVGLLENINTDAFSEGNVLYVDWITAGGLNATAPMYPNIRQEVGTVLVKGVGNGAIQVVVKSMQNDGFISHSGLLNMTEGNPHTQYVLGTSLNSSIDNSSYFLTDGSRPVTTTVGMKRNTSESVVFFYGGNGSLGSGALLGLNGRDRTAAPGYFNAYVPNAAGNGYSAFLSVAGNTDNPIINFNNRNVSSVLDPTGTQDAATKNYVDAVGQAWEAYTTTPTWSGVAPTGETKTFRWTRAGKIVYFVLRLAYTDANQPTGLTISLPTAHASNNLAAPVSAYMRYGASAASLKNPMGYIDTGASVISFFDWQIPTDGQALYIHVSGFYEVA